MQLIILAAGRGSRMQPLTDDTNKCLLDLGDNSFLGRILHRLNEWEPDKVVVVTGYQAEKVRAATEGFQIPIETVHNDLWEQDINIYSMRLALERLSPDQPTIIVEGDIYLDDLAMRDIMFESKRGGSIWFSCGPFRTDQYGGIFECEGGPGGAGPISSIAIVPAYDERYARCSKILGITTIGTGEHARFRALIEQYADRTLRQYWLIPWIENLGELPCRGYDLSAYTTESVNTPEQFGALVDRLRRERTAGPGRIELMPLTDIRPIEAYFPERVELLQRQIADSGVWNKAVVLGEGDFPLFDGHHRFEVARRMGLSKIPAVVLSYDAVECWSLKDSEIVNPDEIHRRARTGELYPQKTAKFYLPPLQVACSYTLEELG